MTNSNNANGKLSEQLFFESVKEQRGEYFVEYHPYVPELRFAFIYLTFTTKILEATIPGLMERELQHWIGRFPVPAMVSAFDDAGSLIHLKDVIGSNHLVGWPDSSLATVVASWELSDLDQHAKKYLDASTLQQIYRGIPFKTGKQVREDAEESVVKIVRRNRYLIAVVIFWAVIVPACSAIMQYFAPDWLNLVILAYGLWKAFTEWRKITGRRKKTQKELDAEEKERKMRHYFYHCERNPDGFLRLKIENFEKEAREQTKVEAASLDKPA